MRGPDRHRRTGRGPAALPRRPPLRARGAVLGTGGGDLAPQVTWGTSPQFSVGVDGQVPEPGELADPAAGQRALEYMGLAPGRKMRDLPVDAAFLGSCTNARLSDLRVAAMVLRGRKVADRVRAICIPGSSPVRRAAEREGLDKVFTDAGFGWRESGCGFCFFAGGEGFPGGARAISSTNRNFADPRELL
jgi:3-isopropylmalate/(R)-2-methylmalate dehydratase large subunit